jgi:hypothetical protein
MRQTRLVLMAGGGVLLLCVLAVIVSLADYTSHPAVAVAHVPPVVGTPPGATDTSDAPSPVPTIPVTTIEQPTPAAPQPAAHVRTQGEQMTLAQLLQQLQQRRHHR